MPEEPMSSRPSTVDSLLAARAAARRAQAERATALILERLAELGVTAELVGSLRDGGFRAHSDIDVLVLDRGGLGMGRILSEAELLSPTVPVDVIFAEVMDPGRIAVMRAGWRS